MVFERSLKKGSLYFTGFLNFSTDFFTAKPPYRPFSTGFLNNSEHFEQLFEQ